MRLSDLLAALPAEMAPRASASDDPVIRGITYDSRAVSPGDLFVALVGSVSDGHDYLEGALGLGASALLVEDDARAAGALEAASSKVPAVAVPDTRRALAPLSARFYGEPADELELVGITGTNGKTSTTYLVESILAQAGRATGLVGTVAIRYASESLRAVNTTPESLDLQQVLRAMRTHGVASVVMEVSSHGLELGRVHGCRFRVGAITNVTQDHLDFHGDMDSYLNAKLRLFREHMTPDGVAVINVDDGTADRSLAAAREAGVRVLRVTRQAGTEAEVVLEQADVDLSGTRAVVRTPSGTVELRSPLLGDFNLENLVVACGIATALELPHDALVRGVERCPQVPGRMELVSPSEDSPTVIVDYAHTPDAVEKLIDAVKPLTPGRVVTVFGCGGDRDRTKRPLMAEAVVKASDRIIATSDNPRTEDPEQIMRDVEAGLGACTRVDPDALAGAERAYTVILDRREAIELAVSVARPGDSVVLAGKGHEDYQIVGRHKLPFDDREEAGRALAEWRRNRSGGKRVMSEAFDARDVCGWTGATLAAGSPDTRFTGAKIDSRVVGRGDLFVAIVGPNHDAHRFLPEVAAAGAAGALVAAGHRPDAALPKAFVLLEVADTTKGLGALGAGHRSRFTGPVIAITGSSGKTTTKEMCAAIVRAAGPALVTEGNLNNDYGVPLTLLRREPEHERAVIEMGMNHRGEIARLVEIAKPDVGLVTNIGVAHIENLGSQEEIANEKGDLYRGLAPDGCAIVNLDDERAPAQAASFPGRRLGYSASGAAETAHGTAQVWARDVTFVTAGAFAFTLETPAGAAPVQVTGLGATTVINATAAAATALGADVPIEHVVVGLESYRPPAGRMAPYPLGGGATVIDDSYNANPVSMRSSLEALAALAGQGRGIAVVGDMGELGDTADGAHRETGRLVAELAIGRLIALGERAPLVVEAARQAGMEATKSFVAADPEEASHRVREALTRRDWVLVKGSRAMKLERVVEALRREAP